MMDELAARRAGRREANLRGLNERIAEAQRRAGARLDELRIVCECAVPDCEQALDIPSHVFERARATDAPRFIVLRDHVLHEIEHAVEGDGEWVIVEKQGAAHAGAAEAHR